MLGRSPRLPFAFERRLGGLGGLFRRVAGGFGRDQPRFPRAVGYAQFIRFRGLASCLRLRFRERQFRMPKLGLKLVYGRLGCMQRALRPLPAGALRQAGRFRRLQAIETLRDGFSARFRPAADMNDWNLAILDEAVAPMGRARFGDALSGWLGTAIRLRPCGGGKHTAPQAERVPHPLFRRV